MDTKNNKMSKFFSTIKSLLFALIVALFIRYIFIQPFKIPSKSMYPTLLVGDQILVDRISYGVGFPCSSSKIIEGFKEIKRGDVVVFRFPEDRNSKDCPNGGFIGISSVYYIKRVVAVPGDILTIKSNKIYINGSLISNQTNRSYFIDGVKHLVYENILSDSKKEVIYKDGETLGNDTDKAFGTVVVPEGSYFVLGDNRDNSRDSRFWGFVPRENIVGKAFLIHFSWNNNFKNVKDILRTRRFFNTIN
jgi:signal peptidase I